MQLKFSDGKAIQFCIACLKTFGYPTQQDLMREVGARQAVTTKAGDALCERHYILPESNKAGL